MELPLLQPLVNDLFNSATHSPGQPDTQLLELQLVVLVDSGTDYAMGSQLL